ncbi:hypothetical protein ACFT5B_06975 [Luteimicrobium sp. NPDC057192]
MDPKNDGWFEPVEAVNYATAARDRWVKDHPDAEPGTVVTVVLTHPDDD